MMGTIPEDNPQSSIFVHLVKLKSTSEKAWLSTPYRLKIQPAYCLLISAAILSKRTPKNILGFWILCLRENKPCRLMQAGTERILSVLYFSTNRGAYYYQMKRQIGFVNLSSNSSCITVLKRTRKFHHQQ